MAIEKRGESKVIESVPGVVGEPTTPQAASPARFQNVTPRAFGLGLAFALLLCAVSPYNDYYIGATYLSGNFLPIGSIFAIVFLALAVNPALIALKRRDRIFTTTEIITVWAMIVVVSGIPSSGMMRYLIPHIVAPYYYATPENGWVPLILSHLPQRLLVTDPFAVRTFFEGLNHGGSVPWRAWAEPLFFWGIFFGLLFALFFTTSSIVRRQWVENDRLTFPLVRLPILIADTPEKGHYHNSFLREPLLWVGVGLVTCLHTIKGLHLFYPSIPDIPTLINAADFLTSPPWNSVSGTILAIYPLVIGVAYLLSSDVCFSLWFFYVLFRLQTLFATIYAWDTSSSGSGINMGPGFVAYQEAGGALMLVVWLVWSMRAHLKQVVHKALTDDPAIDDSREPMSFRAALFGWCAAVAGLFLWMVYAADISPFMTLVVLCGGIGIFLMLSWLVAQAGLLFTQQSFAPSQIAASLAGAHAFHAPTLMMATLTEQVGWYDARELMMPSLLNSYKAGGESGLSARSLTRALAVCVFFAVFVAAASSVWLPYTHGGAATLPNTWMYVASPQIPMQWTADQLQNGSKLATGLLPNMAGGALFVFALFVLRSYLATFSLHPAGFLVAATFPMYAMWFSLFIGWAIKVPIMRYGGVTLYRAALPLFMGLILGDCLNAIVWTVVGLVTGTGYQLLPG